MKRFTLAEVRNHNSREDCWLVIENKVYDVTKWIRFHPGGELPILFMAGHDCSDVFKAFHPESFLDKKLPAFYIGELAEKRKKSPLTEDFEKIRREIIEEGYLQTNYWFYVQKVVVLALLLAVVFYCVTVSGKLYLQIGSACLLAAFWQQIAFIGHDAGHHSITHDFKLDSYIGLVVGNLLTGIGIGWWTKSHNTHHVVTNSVEFDPDIQHLPVFAVTDKFFKSLKSYYHERIMYFDKLSKFFVSNQHLLYYLIMGLARFNLYVQSFLLLASHSKVRMRKLEVFTLFLFWTWFSYLCSFFPTWSSMFLFVFISHFLAGLLHVQITLSHFSMETYHGLPLDAFSTDEFLQSQLWTCMNIDCPPALDFFHGGLQFQIEHHLFPRVSRQYLRQVSEKIQALCLKHKIPYKSKTFLEANCDVIMALRETALKAKHIDQVIWDGISAVG